MHYRPLLPSGKQAPLPWELKLFFINVNWPLRDKPPKWLRYFDRFSVIRGFLTFLWVLEAECMAMKERRKDNIGEALEVGATVVVTVEIILRIFSMAFFKKAFKEFIKQFYLEIYIDKESNPKVFQEIQSDLRPAVMYSYFYLTTLGSYFSIPILGYLDGELTLPFIMSFPFSYASWPVYLMLMMVNIWAGAIVVASIISESYLLATLILHLNARFLQLQQEIEGMGEQILATKDWDNVADNYIRLLTSYIKRNAHLLKFARKLERQYTLRIFAMLSLSALLLCILAFDTYRIGMLVGNLKYVCWTLAKILELIVLGKLGSILFNTTDGMSNRYYCSGWEQIIEKSSNTKANVRAMKLIALTISLNQRPFYLTGLNFFNVSLETTVTILRGAGSYFTFLCSMK